MARRPRRPGDSIDIPTSLDGWTEIDNPFIDTEQREVNANRQIPSVREGRTITVGIEQTPMTAEMRRIADQIASNTMRDHLAALFAAPNGLLGALNGMRQAIDSSTVSADELRKQMAAIYAAERTPSQRITEIDDYLKVVAVMQRPGLQKLIKEYRIEVNDIQASHGPMPQLRNIVRVGLLRAKDIVIENSCINPRANYPRRSSGDRWATGGTVTGRWSGYDYGVDPDDLYQGNRQQNTELSNAQANTIIRLIMSDKHATMQAIGYVMTRGGLADSNIEIAKNMAGRTIDVHIDFKVNDNGTGESLFDTILKVVEDVKTERDLLTGIVRGLTDDTLSPEQKLARVASFIEAAEALTAPGYEPGMAQKDEVRRKLVTARTIEKKRNRKRINIRKSEK